MFNVRVYFLLFTFSMSALAAAEDAPAQFKAWGTRGPGLPPLPAGWTEVPAASNKGAQAQPTETDRARGFVLFQRRAFEELYPDSVPAPHETGVALKAFAAQGQYEPLTFALYALEDLKGCKVSVGALKNEGGASIPASHVDVRIVRCIRSKAAYENPNDKRYRMAPFHLETFETFDAAKDRSAQIWITVKAPDAAPAGDYKGTLAVQAEGKAGAEVPVLLRVLPFTLPPMPLETVMSYAKPNADLALREKELIDQREHGINNVESGCGAVVASRDQTFGDDDIEATRKSCREALALRKRVFGEAANRFPITAEIGHQILYYWNKEKSWFEFWPHSEKLDGDFFKALKLVEETLKAEGGPPMRLFIMDEPGGHPDLLKETIFYNKLAKEKMPHLQSFETIGGGTAMGIDEIGQLGGSVDMLTINRFDTDLCKRLLDRKKPFGIYNGGSSAENVTAFVRDRYFFGFYCWKTGAQEILQWVYAFGEPWKEPLRGNNGYVYLAPDGPLPSIPWESIRAGIDDYRYQDLLWRLITAARKSGDAKAAEAAQAAEQTAREIMGGIDFTYQARITQSPPAPASTMEKWRWLVASACLDLLKHVPLEKALATAVERPGPLDLPFPKAEAAPASYGPEMATEGGFENGAGPWKASGKFAKGSGISSDEHHGGQKSFLLENPAEATGMDVTVCIWGWGPPEPSMILQAGKTYEFSAWIKGSGSAPQLRLALPGGSARKEEDRDGDRDAQGWRKLTHVVTLAKDAKPNYIALWLQGVGKVWCDDLSLREAEQPPFTVRLAQDLADGSDRRVELTVEQPGNRGELQVSVAPPGGKGGVQTLKIPPFGKAMLAFDAAELPPGSYEIKAELSGGEKPFTQSATLRRVRGPFEP
ncbi:MAG: hypothetical protein HY291_19365 [Planctomycetes bacterium]|nr:hypothetical protein [Planctomycetota bacterium]